MFLCATLHSIIENRKAVQQCTGAWTVLCKLIVDVSIEVMWKVRMSLSMMMSLMAYSR
jgi:hypothetical protein